MKKIITIIGARPQIIKASAISRAIKNKFSDKVNEIIVHTGQHYDTNMSEVFFDELQIPKPKYNLNVGSGSHGSQTAKMIEGIEEVCSKENPDYIILYGDTNSTLAGAITASKVHIPVVHIEAGLRSFNKKMPEELNRIICDHCSTYLFPPTQTGINNLEKEGFKTNQTGPFSMDKPFVANFGDIMYDNSLHFLKLAEKNSQILEELKVIKNQYILCTIHRNINTDTKANLQNIFEALKEISTIYQIPIILPLHPRTKHKLEQFFPDANQKFIQNTSIQIIEPVSFLDMIQLEAHAKSIITDSGGVQKEAYFFTKPCLILREETEWTEVITAKAAMLCGANKERIIQNYKQLSSKKLKSDFPKFYGNGDAAEKIIASLVTSN